MVIANPLLLASLVIRVARHAGLGGGFEILVYYRVTLRYIGHMHRARLTAHRATRSLFSACAVFKLAEIRLHIGVGPPLRAPGRTSVIVLLNAPNIDHAVDQCGPAQTFAPRHGDAAAQGIRFGFRLEPPIERLVGHELAEARRDRNPGMSPFPTGFQQQHGMPPRGGEPVRENAACGTTTHDHVVKLFLRSALVHRPSPAYAAFVSRLKGRSCSGP